MRRILVSGGTGFLGSYLVRKLVEGYDIDHVVVITTNVKNRTSLDILQVNSPRLKLIGGDVRNYDFLQRLFSEYEFDTVFHLAAQSEVRKCQVNAKLAYDTNISGTVNLLEVARLYGKVTSIVVSSSDKAYGPSSQLPYLEDHHLNGNGVYEVSKSCQDIIARSYSTNYDLPVAVTRCSNLYGGGDTNYSRVIPNTIRRIRENKSPVIWTGAREFVREFLYVEDAVSAYLAIAETIDVTKGNAYNVGSGEQITIGDLVTKILHKMSSDIQIEYRERVFPEISHQYLDSSKLKSDTDWVAKTLLDDGLEKTIAMHEDGAS